MCSYSSFLLLASLFFSQILSICVSLFSKCWKRAKNLESGAQVNLFVWIYTHIYTQKETRQRCEHTDPAMLNLTAARRHIPDTSDDNFTTGFRPPLQRWDRLTFTTRFWLELTWVRTGPRGKTTEWGLSRPDRQWLCLMLVCHRHRCTDQPQPDLFVCVGVCSGECVVLMEHRAVGCMCVWMHSMQLEGRWGGTWSSN